MVMLPASLIFLRVPSCAAAGIATAIAAASAASRVNARFIFLLLRGMVDPSVPRKILPQLTLARCEVAQLAHRDRKHGEVGGLHRAQLGEDLLQALVQHGVARLPARDVSGA